MNNYGEKFQSPYFTQLSTFSWTPILLGLLFMMLAGCASVPDPNPHDPFEPINRTVFRFNEHVDTAIMKPAAKTYVAVVPSPVRTGVRNVLGNVDDAWSFINAMLQGDRDAAGQNMGRVLVNSFLGIGGLFDVATQANIEGRSEDVGQTLAVWGVPQGPYLVLPLLGPTTVRDGIGRGVWYFASPWSQASNDVQYTATALKLLDERVQLLDTDSLIEDATDSYSFVRSAYWQHRAYQIRNGKPAPLPSGDDEDTP